MDEQQKKIPVKDGKINWTLPSGKQATLIEGFGKHAENASRLIDGDASRYSSALMAQLLTIDGKKLTMEDIRETVTLRDYNDIMAKMGEANFI